MNAPVPLINKHAKITLIMLSVNFVAYIPLTDLSEPGTLKKYGVKPDAETIDMLNTIARQKEVLSISVIIIIFVPSSLFHSTNTYFLRLKYFLEVHNCRPFSQIS